MSAWLARPMLTDDRDQSLRVPNLALDQSTDGSVSPFTNVFEQYKLVHMLSTDFGPLVKNQSVDQALRVDAAIMQWASKLPAEFRLLQPDTSHDVTNPWIPVQRIQLHCFVQMTRLTPMKGFLISPPSNIDSSSRQSIQQLAVSVALECIASAVRLFRSINPLRTRYHFVAFVCFDTAATICSAIIHDHQRNLPERDNLLEAVTLAIDTLDMCPMSRDSTAGPCRLLKQLVGKLSFSSGSLSTLRHSQRDHIDNEVQWHHVVDRPTDHQSYDSMGHEANMLVEAMPGSSHAISDEVLKYNDDRTSTFDLSSVDWDSLFDVDLGPISQIWDSSTLSLVNNEEEGYDME